MGGIDYDPFDEILDTPLCEIVEIKNNLVIKPSKVTQRLNQGSVMGEGVG